MALDPIRVEVYGASPTGDEEVPLLELATTGPCPDAMTPRAHSWAAYRIADALRRTLPQGTIDALFAEFARRQASSLSVRYPAPETPTT